VSETLLLVPMLCSLLYCCARNDFISLLQRDICDWASILIFMLFINRVDLPVNEFVVFFISFCLEEGCSEVSLVAPLFHTSVPPHTWMAMISDSAAWSCPALITYVSMSMPQYLANRDQLCSVERSCAIFH